MFHTNEIRPITQTNLTMFYGLLYVNSPRGHNRLKHLTPVISVKMERLPGNTKNRLFTRSWTARLRFLHPWAVSTCESMYIYYMCIYVYLLHVYLCMFTVFIYICVCTCRMSTASLNVADQSVKYLVYAYVHAREKYIGCLHVYLCIFTPYI